MKTISLLILALAAKFLESCDNKQYEYNHLCCDMCPPGERVIKHCSDYNQTECGICEPGTFQRKWNTKFSCNSCPDGSYRDENVDYCELCATCGVGEYPAIVCHANINTECLPCPENHFSNASRNLKEKCQVCTTCKKYLSRCSRKEDAICQQQEEEEEEEQQPVHTKVKTNVTTTITQSSKSSGVSTSPTVSTRKETRGTITPIVVPTVVLTLFVFAFGLIVVYARKSRCQRGRALLSFPKSKYEPLRTGILLRHQPATFFLKLVESLTAEGRPNWKDLAAALGDFSWDEIANFAVNKSTAAENMLGSWQAKNSSTLDRLYNKLLTIKREDVARFIEENYTTESTV